MSALAPDNDGTKATWHDEITFVDCGSRFDHVACPQCGSVLDRAWLRDRASEASDASAVVVIVPCCDTAMSLNDLIYHEPCGFTRFDISVWNPGRSWLSDSELTTVSEALGHPVRQIMAPY